MTSKCRPWSKFGDVHRRHRGGWISTVLIPRLSKTVKTRVAIATYFEGCVLVRKRYLIPVRSCRNNSPSMSLL